MKIERKLTLEARSTLETGENIATFHGEISTEDPNKLKYTSGIMNQKLYRENRDKVKADETLFENVLYAEQDAMIELAKAEQEVNG